ncbi:hypothetical protein AB0H28_26820 [Micromonospora sp. NPDC050980]|uniref:hypothetical protein n=1 Tax=Micromonospora sp. NPDC050980 TaxID=3155161 RepID=UPI0033CA5A3A
MTSTTQTRPAQLAPVRIGRGRAVHLGNLSSIKGPAGEPRYVSSSCGAGTRGDTVVAGAAIAEPIDCRTCTKANSIRVAWINARVIAATSEPVTLPHTGLTVPHTQLRVDGPTQSGPDRAEQHRLYLGDRFLGWITTHPHRPHRTATYRPVNLHFWGRDLDDYAATARLFTGEAATVADVLAELVREHITAADVAERVTAFRAPVRLMQHTLDGDDQPVGAPYPITYASVTAPLTTDPAWHRAVARALHRDRPTSPGQHWQIWTPTGWTRLPEVFDLDQDLR